MNMSNFNSEVTSRNICVLTCVEIIKRILFKDLSFKDTTSIRVKIPETINTGLIGGHST